MSYETGFEVCQPLEDLALLVTKEEIYDALGRIKTNPMVTAKEISRFFAREDVSWNYEIEEGDVYFEEILVRLMIEKPPANNNRKDHALLVFTTLMNPESIFADIILELDPWDHMLELMGLLETFSPGEKVHFSSSLLHHAETMSSTDAGRIDFFGSKALSVIKKVLNFPELTEHRDIKHFWRVLREINQSGGVLSFLDIAAVAKHVMVLYRQS
ncbi:MAG: hypothetical protein WAV21_02035 [Minisyncoccia bacterium]